MKQKILFIATSHDQMGDTNGATGLWLEQLADPYYIFKEAGFDTAIATPKGGAVPLDPKSESIMMATPSTKKFLKDPEAIDFLSHSTILSEIKADEFDIVFVTGGYGALWDIAGNEIVRELMESFIIQNKLIGLVGQGVTAILTVERAKGIGFIKGKELTGPSNSEERSGLGNTISPVETESALINMGALYSKGPDYLSHIVVSDKMVTGQNAGSSKDVARHILMLTKEKKIDSRILEPDTDKIV